MNVEGKPVFIDLCAGKYAGWTVGFKAAGYYCVGVDIEDFAECYPGHEFIQADVREMDGHRFRGARFMAASPPCQEFSYRDLPWGRRKNLPPPDISIVDACFRLRDEAKPGSFVLENVRGAQPWIGRAPLHRGPFYLWGDVLLVPHLGGYQKGITYGKYRANGKKITNIPNYIKIGCLDRRLVEKTHKVKGNAQTFAKIPFDLAYGLAMAHSGGRP